KYPNLSQDYFLLQSVAVSSGGIPGVVIGAVAYYLADVSNRGLSRIQENRALTALNIASRKIEKKLTAGQ
ncbi:TPA: hypothetical protein ACHJWY_005149, partial [Escherichia coli]